MSRLSVLAWANEVLHTSYASFTDVPTTELALLLHGIFEGGPTAAVSLQEIQFIPRPSPVVRHRNAEHVLAAIERLSQDPSGSPTGGIVPRHLTAAAWLDGQASVEELKIWRWVRAAAADRGVSVELLQQRIEAYLRRTGTVTGGGPHAPAPPPPAGEARPAAPLRAMEPNAPSLKRPRGAPDERSPDAAAAPAEADDRQGRRLYGLLEDARRALEEQGGLLPPDGTPTSSAAVERAHGTDAGTECAVCPAIVATALQSNLGLMEQLEQARKHAIAACLKKDPTALLAALRAIV